MARKKAASAEECGSWMDTYGDMVTLLLCFFVLLYSMSDINQQKWEVFVKSIFPNSGDTPQIAINEQLGEGEYDVSGNMEMEESTIDPENMENLFITLTTMLTEAGVEGVSVSREDGYTFLVFENQTFFGGNSSVLTEEAMQILNVLCDVIAPYTEGIAQINIMGHTAQASAVNDVRTDRILSAMRSAEVAAYIEQKNVIDPSKLVGLSYGMYRALDDSGTAEGRAKNRRVEFMIIDNGADIKSMNDFYNEYYNSLEAGTVEVTGTMSEENPFSALGGNSMDGSSSMAAPPQAGAEEGAAESTEGADGAQAPPETEAAPQEAPAQEQ